MKQRIKGGNVSENIERDLGKILQKIEDNESWLKSIDTKLSFTNGKIAATMQELALIKQKQEDCPALKDHDKNNSIPLLTKVSLIISILINMMLVFSRYLGFGG